MTNLSRRDLLRAAGGAALVCAGGSAVVEAEDTAASWPTVRATGSNRGFDPDSRGPRTGVDERWSSEIGATTAPTLDDSSVFVGSDAGVHALARDTGTEAWLYETADPIAVPPFVDWQTVTASTTGGQVVRLGLAGEAEWTASVGGEPSSPMVVDEYTIVAADGDLYCLQNRDGELNWRTDADDPLVALEHPGYAPTVPFDGVQLRESPPPTDESVFAPTADPPGIVAVEITSGAVEWTTEIEDAEPPVRMPAYADDRLYVVDESQLIALDADAGTERWRDVRTDDPPGEPLAPPVVTLESVYAPGDGGIDEWTLDGEFRGRYGPEIDEPITELVASGGTLFAVTASKTVYAIGGDEGVERYQLRLPDADGYHGVAVAMGALYVGHEGVSALDEGGATDLLLGEAGVREGRGRSALWFPAAAVTAHLLSQADWLPSVDRS